jgi:RNA polymerase sigma-70 factor (ECF subfamily)
VALDARETTADAALLRRVARRDERALGELYDRHAGWLTVRLARRCGSADLVDQAVQDTFLAVWRQAGRYRGDGDVAAFLWGIAIRRLVDVLRRDGVAGGGALSSATAVSARWLAEGLTVQATGERALAVRSAEDEVLLGIEYGHLGPALARLSPELRAAMEATVLDGLTYAEAGKLLGIPTGTVKSRCHRARMELREALA